MSFWEFLGTTGATIVSGIGVVIGVVIGVAVAPALFTAWIAYTDWHWAWKLLAIPVVWAAALFILLLLAWTVSLIGPGAAS